MEAHTWNPSIWEAKAGVTQVCGHRSLHSKFKISLDYTAGHCLKKKERERGKEGKGKTDTYIKTKYGVRIKFLMCSSAFCYCNKPAQITSSQGGKSHLAVRLQRFWSTTRQCTTAGNRMERLSSPHGSQELDREEETGGGCNNLLGPTSEAPPGEDRLRGLASNTWALGDNQVQTTQG